jgi:DNA processing protein
MGIDTICHKAAIRAGGITYAVIASGIDCINPGYAKELADKIVDSGGAIISEYKCGTTALPGYFPQRNRIISGLSKATIVVEAPKKSGALITANFAFDQQRDVYAIPGNINSEKSAGCNLLIKISKASIALSPEQVCEDMGLNENERDNLFQENIDIQFSNKNEEAVFSKLTYEPLHIDALAADCSLDISNLLVSLLNLELKGFVRQLPGKYYIRS